MIRRSTTTAAAGSRPRRGWLSSRPPSVAVEIATERVAAVSVEDGRDRVVSAHAVEPLPPGVLEPALNAPNIHDEATLVAALRRVLESMGTRVRRAALVLPDTVAKVSLIRFDKVPARLQDLDQLIRWQVRKSAPFRIEDAQVSWIPGVTFPEGGQEYIVSIARRDIIEGYERVLAECGVHAGLVDLASLNLINAVIAAGAPAADADWLLVHLAADYATLAVLRGSNLVFFRNRAGVSDADLTDLVHQTAMYHEDRLGGGGFWRVVLAGAAARGAEQAERLRRLIEERGGTRVEAIDFRQAAAMRDRISAAPELLDSLAPALGVLLRERGVA
jgi:Tfp pilus assembly PilM family ATPase